MVVSWTPLSLCRTKFSEEGLCICGSTNYDTNSRNYLTISLQSVLDSMGKLLISEQMVQRMRSGQRKRPCYQVDRICEWLPDGTLRCMPGSSCDSWSTSVLVPTLTIEGVYYSWVTRIPNTESTRGCEMEAKPKRISRRRD